MRIYDIIEHKRDNKALTKEEIEYFVEEYSRGRIPDYQMSALIMAIYINGMTDEEVYDLTFAMARSSKMIDLSYVKENEKDYIVDKHSTGGVGDKVTLIVIPIVASFGVKIFKMSGRGLGYTGGTADKFESIEGFDLGIGLDKAVHQVKEIGECLISQSDEIAIADKKIYALRDVTATVSSIPLIASSIMSKKIASGVDKLVLDVTVGSGSFMQNMPQAKQLAKLMVKIGKKAGIDTEAIITSMEQPLGKSVGNVVEIKEAISFLLSDANTLNTYENRELKEVVFEVAAHMLKMAGLGDDIEKNKKAVLDAIVSRRAYNKFAELVKAQNGKLNSVYMDWIGESLDLPVLKDEVKYMKEIYADKDGYIVEIDSKKIGEALVALGGARETKESSIDHAVGFEFSKKVGSKVKKGEVIITALYNDKEKFENAFEYINEAVHIEKIEQSMSNVLKSKPVILDVIN